MKKDLIKCIVITTIVWLVITGVFLFVFYKQTPVCKQDSLKEKSTTNIGEKDDFRLPSFYDYLTSEKDELYVSSKKYAEMVNYDSNKELNAVLDEGDKTNIDENFKKKPNFADHYIATPLGCGTSCQFLVIADVITGKLYYPKISAERGFDFDHMSKLLIANPPWDVYMARDAAPGIDLPSTYYVWENNELKLLREYYLDISVKEKK